MDYRHRFDLEVRINELATRRRMLDKQLELRSSTMAELGQVREMSMKRLCNAVEAQNEQARARNQELREYLYSSSSTHRQPALKPDSHRSAHKLKEAKEQYLKHVEATLPIWHRYQTVQLEENVRSIQVEKALSIKRREQLQSELLRENAVKQQLERHRQELLYSLAAEQRIMLESKANAVLLEEESKATNAQVAYELSLAANEMNELVASNVYKMRQATSQQNDALLRQSAERHEELRMRQSLYQPQPYQPTVHAHHPHSHHSHPQHAAVSIAPAGLGSLVLPTELEEAPEYLPQTELSRRDDNSLPMSPTAASAYYPRSRSSSATHFPVSQPASAPNNTTYVAVRQAQQYQSPPKPMNHSVNHSVSHSGDGFNATLTSPLTEANRSALLHQTQLDADMTFTTAVDANESALSLPGHRQDHRQDHHSVSKFSARSDQGYGQESTHHRLFNGALDTHLEENEEEPTPNSKLHNTNLSLEVDLPFHSFVAPARQASPAPLPNSPNGKVGSPQPTFTTEDTHESPAPTPTKRPFSGGSVSSHRSSFTVPVEVRPGSRQASPLVGAGSSTSGRSGFFSAEEETSTHSVSRRNSTGLSETGSTKSNNGNGNTHTNNIGALVESLSLSQCTALLAAVCQEIERRATEFPAPVSVTVIYDTFSRHRAVHIVDAFLTSGSADNAHLSAVLGNAADSTLGNAVLAMVEGKSSVLIPSEAFTGVMTMEKLKKEYKRGPAGVLQLWDRLVAHLMRLVEHSSNALNFLSLCFTDALTVHVDKDDKSRLARKVSNLLQLALIPPQSKDQRSPSPPYRSRSNYHSTTSPSHPSHSHPTSSTATAATTGKPNSQVHNPNTSGFSLSRADGEFGARGGEKKSFSAYVPSRGSPHKSVLNNSVLNNTALYGQASSVLKVTKAATEFDDDEIADDETIERPPPLRDLDTSSITPSNNSSNNHHKNNASSISYSSSDSSSVQPVSRAVRSAGGNNNNNNNVSMHAGTQGRNDNRKNEREEYDEFDF